MTKEEALNIAKEKAMDLYNFLVDNSGVIKDATIEQHTAAIIKKFMGGLNENKVVTNQARTTSNYVRYEPPKKQVAGKKKEKPSPVVADKSDGEKPLDQQSDSELKITARDLGIDFKGKNRHVLMKEIRLEKRKAEDKLMETGFTDDPPTTPENEPPTIEQIVDDQIEKESETDIDNDALIDENAINESILD